MEVNKKSEQVQVATLLTVTVIGEEAQGYPYLGGQGWPEKIGTMLDKFGMYCKNIPFE